MRLLACRIYAGLFGAPGVLSMLVGLIVLYGLTDTASPAGHFSGSLSTIVVVIGMGCVALGLLYGFLGLLAVWAARSAQPHAQIPTPQPNPALVSSPAFENL